MRGAALLAVAALACGAALAQNVSGTAYEDRNANGVRDGGEPAVPSARR